MSKQKYIVCFIIVYLVFGVPPQEAIMQKGYT